jgi:hypothetical protein
VAIRDRILVPENIAYAAERALKRFAEGIRRADPQAIQKRLDEIEDKVENLVRLAAKTGNIDAAARHYAELEAEREELRAKLAFVPPAIDWDLLRAMAEERVLEIRWAFEASDEHRRAALRGLLAGRRLQVGPHRERLFRVDGLREVGLERPPARVSGRGDRVVAGWALQPRHPDPLHPLCGLVTTPPCEEAARRNPRTVTIPRASSGSGGRYSQERIRRNGRPPLKVATCSSSASRGGSLLGASRSQSPGGRE